ncbi:hypothetical protein LEMLEM_LOCUS2849 [Lemmus lemmus]
MAMLCILKSSLSVRESAEETPPHTRTLWSSPKEPKP